MEYSRYNYLVKELIKRFKEDNNFYGESLTVEEYLSSTLGFCGCGRPGDVVEMVIEIFNILNQDFEYDEKTDKLKELFGISDDKKYYTMLSFVFYILDNKNILTHGSSIGGAWIDEDFKELLELYKLEKRFEYEWWNIRTDSWLQSVS